MSISESQLETWSHQGAVTTAKLTADSLKTALDSLKNWPEGVAYEVYLQGSYKNATNIRGNSDVDVVAQLTSAFYNNLLVEQRKILGLTDTYYQWEQFKSDVLKSLRNYYGWPNVTEGNKSIKVKGGNGRMSADVVVCATYRKYYRVESHAYVEGMCFWTRDENRQIINYPKRHYENGCTKMSLTNNKYKPVVRIFKNVRSALVEKNVISRDLAPSYFIECLLYNTPNSCFGNKYLGTVISVLKGLVSSDWSAFKCQNEQEDLFGNSPEQWSANKASTFLSKFIEFLNN